MTRERSQQLEVRTQKAEGWMDGVRCEMAEVLKQAAGRRLAVGGRSL